MKREMSFFNTLKISAFDFKSYDKFIDMNAFKVFLNRALFVLLISLVYMVFLNKDIKSIEEFASKKGEIFQDINFSNGNLNISNSPTIFTNEDFILIGDTRDDFNINNFPEYDNYRTGVILLKDSFIFKHKVNEFKIKYSDVLKVSNISSQDTLSKDEIFLIIDSMYGVFRYLLYSFLPVFMIFNYFFLAFITSFFAMFFSIISRFRTTKHGIKFTHIYKMVLFAQTIPFLIISIFEIIAKVNGVAFVFPINILEFLTIFVFIISMFSIRKKNLKDVKKN